MARLKKFRIEYKDGRIQIINGTSFAMAVLCYHVDVKQLTTWFELGGVDNIDR
jgi:hypothetical protein